MKSGIEHIAEERQRQIDVERYDATHDDTHTVDELVLAAMAYLMHEVNDPGYNQAAFDVWPWDLEQFKSGTDAIRNLTKAGALIAAEIDRLQRINAPSI